jgi:hypothetical protein
MENYTPRQVALIRNAIRHGRIAAGRSAHGDAEEFARAFIKHDGIHAPGAALDGETRRWLIACLLVSLRDGQVNADQAAKLGPILMREYNRALAETYLVRHFGNPEIMAYRILMPSEVRRVSSCRRFVRSDAFGLGPGVVPLEEIVVPPACCDGIRFQVLLPDAS